MIDTECPGGTSLARSIGSRLACAFLASLMGCGPPAGPPTPLPQQAFVWQRVWTPEVSAAVEDRSPDLIRLVVLGMEVDWDRGAPHATRIALDEAALVSRGQSWGFAVRFALPVGPLPSWAPGSPLAHAIGAVLADLPRGVDEIQLDADAPETQLGTYASWIDGVRAMAGPRAVTITALPSWLDEPAFEELARRTDGYVLQVHSLERPGGKTPLRPLCDPVLARRWVERAATLDVPFRVALPTYAYRAVRDRTGALLGFAAEGAARDTGERIGADPAVMADLVRSWNEHPPRGLQAIVWFRLPVEGDSLNWSRQTLATVMRGERPRAAVDVGIDRTDPRLVEVTMVNRGTASSTLPVVRVRWTNAKAVGGDALRGYTLRESIEGAILTPPRGIHHLEPGERLTIAWLRYDTPPRDLAGHVEED